LWTGRHFLEGQRHRQQINCYVYCHVFEFVSSKASFSGSEKSGGNMRTSSIRTYDMIFWFFLLRNVAALSTSE
jgi:hypothetical protein